MNTKTKNRIIRKALLSRKVEELLLKLFSEGELSGTVHTCIGQEFVGAVISEFISSNDTVFSNHRCHGHFLSITGNTVGLIAELMGKENGVCGGIGGSQHLCYENFYSNGIQGSSVPVAAGVGLASKIKKDASISVAFIGDGTLGEGIVYETLNIISKWEIPLLIVLENNGFSQSTSQVETLAGAISERPKSFGIETAKSDTWNWEELYQKSKAIVSFVRKEQKPGFFIIDTFRLKAHSKGDDNRSIELVEGYEEKDPLNIIFSQNDSNIRDIVENVEQEITTGLAEASRSSVGKRSSQLSNSIDNRKLEWKNVELPKTNYVRAINESFKKIFVEFPNTIMLGEDIKSPYGGAFKATMDLSDLFPDRVLNTPISEGAITGIGTGLAICGFAPFVEIMFGDFMSLAFDQIINNLAKYNDMYNGQVTPNVIIRTPMGGGRGYGPTHSQTLDKHFLGIPGLTVLAINNCIDPRIIYPKIVANQNGPVLLIENKKLYGDFFESETPDGFSILSSDCKYPSIWIRPDASYFDVTIISYGGMTPVLTQIVYELFEKHDIIAQAIYPTQIYPFSIQNIIEPLSMGKHIVLVEEGQSFAGFSAEIIAQLAEIGLLVQRKIIRIGALPTAIPSSGELEKEVLPNREEIVRNILELVE